MTKGKTDQITEWLQWESLKLSEWLNAETGLTEKAFAEIREWHNLNGTLFSSATAQEYVDILEVQTRATIDRMIDCRKESGRNSPGSLEDSQVEQLFERIVLHIRSQSFRIPSWLARRTGSLSSERIRNIHGGLETYARQEIEILKTEARFGLIAARTENTTTKIDIGGSIVGNVSVGSVGPMESNILFLQNKGEEELASALKKLASAVSDDDSLSEEQKQNALEVLQELAEQAQKPEQKRKQGVIRTLWNGLRQTLSTGANVATVCDQWGPKIKDFFGL